MANTINLTYKYRLYPNKPEIKKLEETFEICRLVYNSMLNNRKFQYEVNKKSTSCYTQIRAIASWKPEHQELKEVHSTILQNIAKRVNLAFEAFFRRVKNGETPGYPRCKGKNQYKSITYTQSGFEIVNGKLSLSKIGELSIRLHRPIVGIIKTCTICKKGNKWFACFAVEQPVNYTNTSSEEVGIDVGITKFVALSNGEFIENPRFFRKEEKNLAKAQRKFEKVKDKHGSKTRKKAKKVVSRVHERTRNRRLNFLHQTSRKVVNEFGIIYLEDLQVDNMMKSPKAKPDPDNPGQFLPNGASAKAGLNKSIQDVSWSMFRNFLTYKAENAGGIVKAHNPAYTSQMCSECGYIDKENRPSQAVFECKNPDPEVNCKYKDHADTNAAKNHKAIGHDSLFAATAAT